MPKVIAYLNNYVLYLDSAAPDSGAAKMTVLYDHLHLTLQQALASYHLAAGLRPALAQADRILAEFERGALPMSAIWETLCTEYNLYNQAVNIFLIATGFMTFLKKASH